MEFHLLVACFVYAVAIMYGIFLLFEIPIYLSDTKNRAKLKRKIRKILRTILYK